MKFIKTMMFVMLIAFCVTNGDVRKEYYDNGNLKRETTYKGSKPNGKFVSYYENGRVMEKGSVKNGKKNGKYEAYYPNGRLMLTTSLKDGQINGRFVVYHEGGKVKMRAEFKYDKINGKYEEYYSDGALYKSFVYLNGVCQKGTVFRKDGKWARAEIVGSKPEIILKAYRKDGSVYFSREDKMKDDAGNEYELTLIGDQIWMAKNMNLKMEETSWCYAGDSTNCEKYGRLYNWDAANVVCPRGWHLPSKEEFFVLLENVCRIGKVQENGFCYDAALSSGEQDANIFASDLNMLRKGSDFGFEALYAGFRGYSEWPGSERLGEGAFFWSSTGYGNSNSYGDWPSEKAYFLGFNYKIAYVTYDDGMQQRDGLSVRCLKD